MKEPIEILLRVLLSGHTVTDVTGEEYGMDNEGHLCMKASRFSLGYTPNEDPEEVWVQVPCDVSELKTIADRIGRDTLWLKACEVSMRSLLCPTPKRSGLDA
jgi:hypothetical protein